MTDKQDLGDDILAGIAALVVGVLGGIALSAILSALSKRRCPICGNPIPNQAALCPYCNTILRQD
jgi:hypothetical protein